jgi:hypothetical protein
MERGDVLLFAVGLLLAVGSLVVILHHRPSPGVSLRWTFASIAGLIAGVVGWLEAGLLGGLLAICTVTFLVGTILQWLMGITSKQGNGSEKEGDISAEPGAADVTPNVKCRLRDDERFSGS